MISNSHNISTQENFKSNKISTGTHRSVSTTAIGRSYFWMLIHSVNIKSRMALTSAALTNSGAWIMFPAWFKADCPKTSSTVFTTYSQYHTLKELRNPSEKYCSKLSNGILHFSGNPCLYGAYYKSGIVLSTLQVSIHLILTAILGDGWYYHHLIV